MLVTDAPALTLPELPVPPFRLSGTVYAALLNHRPQLQALGEAVNAAPYKAPPRAPVLALRPRHMLRGAGAAIAVPGPVEVGISVGIVIGRPACALTEAQAMAAVAGYLIVGELGLPTESHYRPGVRFKARDGFCPLGPVVVPAGEVAAPEAIGLQVALDGQPVWSGNTGDRVRGVAKLLADVTDFMTLMPGDVLTLGVSHGAPLARPGQAVTLSAQGLGALSFTLVADTGAEAGA